VRCECNFAGLEIDGAPSELCQVAETLAEIQAKQHETAPFGIVEASSQDAFDFFERERAPLLPM
jgi:hypothetical protein